MNVETTSRQLYDRMARAAQGALEDNGSVGPLELLQYMGFLHASHIEQWRKGNEFYPNLQAHFQVGPDKLRKTLQHFESWVKERGLQPVQASYARRGVGGVVQLRITLSGDPAEETFYRTHYAAADLAPAKSARLEQKLNRAPDLVVFEKTSEEGNCSECGAELIQGSYLFLEQRAPLCLTCADLDQLVFLPAGDTAMSRRARKQSPLNAVVVRFNRRRKRYERQGLLVAPEAIARAEEECATDAPERAEARARAAVARQEQDVDFVQALTQSILDRFPRCPAAEAGEIARHTALRGSGRVGRSAAGRDLDPAAVDLAVIAHIRHTHTNYDRLLMSGVPRMDARAQIRPAIDRVLDQWRTK